MNGIQIVAEARVGNDPELREVSGTPVCNLSLAVTERKQNKQTNTWEDGTTTWLRGAVWGPMAHNVAVSITKGMNLSGESSMSITSICERGIMMSRACISDTCSTPSIIASASASIRLRSYAVWRSWISCSLSSGSRISSAPIRSSQVGLGESSINDGER